MSHLHSKGKKGRRHYWYDMNTLQGRKWVGTRLKRGRAAVGFPLWTRLPPPQELRDSGNPGRQTWPGQQNGGQTLNQELGEHGGWSGCRQAEQMCLQDRPPLASVHPIFCRVRWGSQEILGCSVPLWPTPWELQRGRWRSTRGAFQRAQKLPGIPAWTRCHCWPRAGNVCAVHLQHHSARQFLGLTDSVSTRSTAVSGTGPALSGGDYFADKGSLFLKASGQTGLFFPRRLQQRSHLLICLSVVTVIS